MNDLGNIATERGDLEGAERFYVEVLDLSRAARDGHGIGMALTNTGYVCRVRAIWTVPRA